MLGIIAVDRFGNGSVAVHRYQAGILRFAEEKRNHRHGRHKVDIVALAEALRAPLARAETDRTRIFPLDRASGINGALVDLNAREID